MLVSSSSPWMAAPDLRPRQAYATLVLDQERHAAALLQMARPIERLVEEAEFLIKPAVPLDRAQEGRTGRPL